MSRTIVLVACVSKKNNEPMPARDLYISDWFRKASAYAEQITDEWYILSAKHGLVAPEHEIEPYDQTLNEMHSDARKAWAGQVINEIKKYVHCGDQIILLAGNRYREHLIEPLRRMGCYVEVPMEGLRIGEQLSWLNHELGE